ncbi:hypothetical protein BT69DRAFT_519635 [Atractiella rhizophila]|nr:hypothetical protein BT69DRAFT_519635 [Atractiella rhizophila]
MSFHDIVGLQLSFNSHSFSVQVTTEEDNGIDGLLEWEFANIKSVDIAHGKDNIGLTFNICALPTLDDREIVYPEGKMRSDILNGKEQTSYSIHAVLVGVETENLLLVLQARGQKYQTKQVGSTQRSALARLQSTTSAPSIATVPDGTDLNERWSTSSLHVEEGQSTSVEYLGTIIPDSQLGNFEDFSPVPATQATQLQKSKRRQKRAEEQEFSQKYVQNDPFLKSITRPRIQAELPPRPCHR